MTSKTDKDLVLDFINSLPDSKPGTPKPSDGKAENAGDGENILEFLDEIALKKDLAPPKKEQKAKFEPKKKDQQASQASAQATPQQSATTSAQPSKQTSPTGSPSISSEKKEIEIDPIASISSWWSSEGQSKVTSLWGTIASNAQTLGETTYQLASQTSNQINEQRHKYLEGDEQIHNISDRLNSILVTMSNQIKQGLISKDDELLNVLVVYDMSALGYIDQITHHNFSKVMEQVEGGIRVNVTNFNHRQGNNDNVDLNMFYGKIIDGEKLCFANLESAVKDYLKVETAQEKSEEDIEEINKSNIFVSIQPITTRLEGQEPKKGEEQATLIDSNNQESFSFTIMLKDITNDITIITRTQAFPLRWAEWLTGKTTVNSEEDEINPADWVKTWIREGLDLSIGVLAQQYVIKRMGI